MCEATGDLSTSSLVESTTKKENWDAISPCLTYSHSKNPSKRHGNNLKGNASPNVKITSFDN